MEEAAATAAREAEAAARRTREAEEKEAEAKRLAAALAQSRVKEADEARQAREREAAQRAAAEAAKPAEPPDDAPGAPDGMEYLGRNPQGGDEYRNLKDASTMVLIPAGDFLMGGGDVDGGAGPPRRVRLRSYLLDKTEVTWGQYGTFCRATGRARPAAPAWGIDDRHPVVNVTWHDAAAYCAWAGKRLPTEAEWEKGARGADGRTFPWGNTWAPERANADDRLKRTSPVGSLPAGASPWGLMDLAGNVWEWCADGYAEAAPRAGAGREREAAGPPRERVLRGGSWAAMPLNARCAARFSSEPTARIDSCGFRGARDVRP